MNGFCGSNSVLHQHSDGHGADATGYRREPTCNICDGRVNIAGQPPTSLTGVIVHAINADIDHDGSRLDPIGFHHVWSANCCHENVGFFANGFQFLGS